MSSGLLQPAAVTTTTRNKIAKEILAVPDSRAELRFAGSDGHKRPVSLAVRKDLQTIVYILAGWALLDIPSDNTPSGFLGDIFIFRLARQRLRMFLNPAGHGTPPSVGEKNHGGAGLSPQQGATRATAGPCRFM